MKKMKTMIRMRPSLIIALMLVLTVFLMSACANDYPVDESRLRDIDNSKENTAETEQQMQKEQSVQQADQEPAEQQIPQSDEPGISESQAMKIALDKVPGATSKNITSFGREYDYGRWIYEGEIRYEGLEYEFEIDAQTGNILEWEIDD